MYSRIILTMALVVSLLSHIVVMPVDLAKALKPKKKVIKVRLNKLGKKTPNSITISIKGLLPKIKMLLPKSLKN